MNNIPDFHAMNRCCGHCGYRFGAHNGNDWHCPEGHKYFAAAARLEPMPKPETVTAAQVEGADSMMGGLS